MSEILENFRRIETRIRTAERLAGSKPGTSHLMAVTKNQSQENIREALNHGHRLFGENKVQEAAAHWQDLKKKYAGIELHLIGPLQTNKVKEAVTLFDCIQTIDREKIARAVGDEIRKQGKSVSCMIQVNTGEEPQKAGIIPAQFSDFLKFCQKECGLNITGLMCIPPANESPALHFALLKKLAARHGLKELSMGMSADFEQAIALGASYIRIGTALFGGRT